MDKSAKNLPKNLFYNALSFLIKLSIGLCLVPFFIDNLGVAAYGLIPLALIFTEYACLISQSFNVSTARFLSIELNKEDGGQAIRIFNSSIVVILLIIIVQLAGFLALIGNLEAVVAIPDGYVADTKYLFIFTYIGFTFTMLASVFNVSLYSKNRLDIIQKNEIVKQVVTLLAILILFTIFRKNLASVGVATLSGGVIVLLLSIFQWRRITPDLHLNLRRIDFTVIRPLITMSMWVMVNTIGVLLYIRVDAYVVNRFISAEASGEYSAVLQFSQVMRTAVALIANAIAPLGVIYYARGEIGKLLTLNKVAVKYLTVLIAPTLAVLCVFSGNILSLWLGNDFVDLGGLMTLQLAPLLINLGIYPLLNLNICTNHVKVPAMVTCVLGGLNFVLAVWFVLYTSFGYYGVAIAGAIMLTLKNAVFTPVYAARILQVSFLSFYRPLLAGVINFFLSISLLTVLKNIVSFESFFYLIPVSLLFIVFNIVITVRMSKTHDEKAALIELLPAKLRFVTRII